MPFAALTPSFYWFLPPLVLAISLVYAASRHEEWSRIFRHAARLFCTILLVMAATTAILLMINTQV